MEQIVPSDLPPILFAEAHESDFNTSEVSPGKGVWELWLTPVRRSPWVVEGRIVWFSVLFAVLGVN